MVKPIQRFPQFILLLQVSDWHIGECSSLWSHISLSQATADDMSHCHYMILLGCHVDTCTSVIQNLRMSDWSIFIYKRPIKLFNDCISTSCRCFIKKIQTLHRNTVINIWITKVVLALSFTYEACMHFQIRNVQKGAGFLLWSSVLPLKPSGSTGRFGFISSSELLLWNFVLEFLRRKWKKVTHVSAAVHCESWMVKMALNPLLQHH